MATYTPNLGLHQRAATDSFLRTDYNTGLNKIDTAVLAGLTPTHPPLLTPTPFRV